MKLFIISDLHGSATFTKKALDRFDKSGAESLIILGDFYYHGPRNPLPEGYAPMEESKLLNSYAEKIIAIRGNCDAEVDEYISKFSFHPFCQITAPNGKVLSFIHGHKNVEMPLKTDVLFYGHTHIALIETKDGIIIANPGSVSLPKANNSRGYILVNDSQIILFDLLSGKQIKEISY